ncbi:MAG: CBS domain-containing protein [Bernardetiaceae bacterium]
MGSLNVRLARNNHELNAYTRRLLRDIQALEQMLDNDAFENDNIKIGAEQEICLVDDHGKPAPMAMEVLNKLDHPNFTTEIARFNIEANLNPLPFTGNCFSQMESNLHGLLAELQRVTQELGIEYLLTGILPTIRKFDLVKENLTPLDRYHALIESLRKLRGKEHELRIEGLDELNVLHDSALLEACNTSFQVHLQVRPSEFVSKYNVAQAIAAPVMALCSNSPMLFGKRLWSETRIALFRQSVDTRVASEHIRERSPRVTFGSGWLRNSILDLYREDIMRFRVLLMSDDDEDALRCLAEGKTPRLSALNIHNSTVYRWNRACYGQGKDEKPHLRIENRILPAGPSVVDEIANAALWIGLMNGFEDQYPDITKVMDFDDAKSNFHQAARSGLGASFTWIGGKNIKDTELIAKELIPLAKHGLQKAGVASEDITKYIDIIEARNETICTGSRWILSSYSKLIKSNSREEVTVALTASIMNRQRENLPVHTWELASVADIAEWEPSSLMVEEFMDTDLITVNEDDTPDFASDIMNWQRIRYLPVENAEGKFVGLLSSRKLLRHYTRLHQGQVAAGQHTVRDLMIKDPITTKPEANITELMEVMGSHQIGCVPVIVKGELAGLITEANYLNITASLLKRIAERRKSKRNNKNGQEEPPAK